MKKFLIIAIAVCSWTISSSQGKFAASLTNTGNLLTFQLKPDVTTMTGFSTIEFFVRYPDHLPNFAYGNVTVNTAAFPGMLGNGSFGGGVASDWQIFRDDPAYSLPGYHVDHFVYTAPATATTIATYTGGVAYNLVSFELLGTPPNTVDLQFVTDDQEATYYLAITDRDGGELRPASISDYFFPGTATTVGPNGSTIYYQELLNVPLPVKFTDFTLLKVDDKALLSWSVENETPATDKYEILRSTNGRDFTTIQILPALNNGRSANTYSFTQEDISKVVKSGAVYFRIKQYDKDGKFAITEIKNIRVNLKGLIAGVYPNPIKQSANVSFDLEKDAIVLLSVTDASGKQLLVKQVQGFKGSNIKPIDMSKVAGGNYLLKVQTGDETKVLPIVKATN